MRVEGVRATSLAPLGSCSLVPTRRIEITLCVWYTHTDPPRSSRQYHDADCEVGCRRCEAGGRRFHTMICLAGLFLADQGHEDRLLGVLWSERIARADSI